MANTHGEKELRTDWPVRDTTYPYLVAEEGSVVEEKDKEGID